MKPYLVASIVVFWKTTLSQVQLPHVFFVQVFVCCGYGEMNHIHEIGIRPFWTCTWYQTVQKHAATADEIKSNLKMKTKPWISIRTWGCEKKNINMGSLCCISIESIRFGYLNTFANTFVETTSYCCGFMDNFTHLVISFIQNTHEKNIKKRKMIRSFHTGDMISLQLGDFASSSHPKSVSLGFHTPITSKAMMPNTAGAAATPGQSHERGAWRL